MFSLNLVCLRLRSNFAVLIVFINILPDFNLANTRCVSDRTLDNIGSTDFHPQRVRFEGDSRGCCAYL